MQNSLSVANIKGESVSGVGQTDNPNIATSTPSTPPSAQMQPVPPTGSNNGNTYARRASAAFVGNILNPTQWTYQYNSIK